MKRPLWLSLGLLLALVLGTVSALTALLVTEGGLRLALALAQRLTPGELRWAQAQGRLVGPLQIDALHYQAGPLQLGVQQLAFDWAPGRLLARRLSIHNLQMRGVKLQLPESTEQESAPIEPGWALPLELRLRNLQVDDLTIVQGTAAPVQIVRVQAVAQSGLEWIDFDQLLVETPHEQLTATGRLGLGRAVRTDLNFNVQVERPDYAPLAGSGRIVGTWTDLVWAQQLSQPSAAQFSVRVQEPFSALRWSLALELPVTRLDRLLAGAPPQQLAARLTAQGDLQQAELALQAQTDWQAQALYPVELNATARRADDGQIELQSLLLRQGQAQLQASGHWSPQSQQFELHSTARALRWPLFEEAVVQIPSLQLALTGTPDAYQFRLDGQLQPTQAPALELAGHGQGDVEAVQLEQLQVSALGGRLQSQGRLAWSPSLSWEVEITAQDIDPGRHWPEWPGQLAARLQTQGQQTDQGLDLRAQIESLSGQLRGYPVSAQGRLQLENERLQLQEVALQSGTARLSLAGQVDSRWALDWRVQAPELGQAVPGLSGRLQAQGTLQGPRDAPRVQGQAQLAHITQGDLRLEALQVQADVSAAAQAPLSLTAQGENLSIGARQLERVALNLSGQLERHRLTLDANGQSHALTLSAAGGWQDSQWKGRLERADWALPETGAWQLASPGQVWLSPRGSGSDELCWQQQAASLCAQLSSTERLQVVQLQLADWPLGERLKAHLPPDMGLEGGNLSVQLLARQDLAARKTTHSRAALTASVQGQLAAGQLQWQSAQQREQMSFAGAELDLQLDEKGLRNRALLQLSGNDRLSLQAELPGYWLGRAPAEQALSGRLQGKVQDLTMLEGLFEDLDEVAGELHADVALAGTLADPRLNGSLGLKQANVFIGPAGVRLQDLHLTLSGDPASGRLQLDGGVRSGPGQLSLDGSLEAWGEAGLSGQLHITGEQFEAVNIPEARVLLSPDLQLAMQPQKVQVTGSLVIPEARIEPRDLSGAKTPSKDVVLVDENEAPAPTWAVSSRIKVSLGDKVDFNGFGLSGRLSGVLDVVDEPGRVTLASGELRILNGEYKAYGQALKIDRGRVLYRGGAIDNPQLDVRAVRRTGDVLAGVKVFGELQAPEVELFSQPSLPQADQLSYLLLGRPVDTASGSEGELLFKAASSLGLKGGNALAQNIGNSFGLDEVSVGGGDDLESAALVVGKYLTPRLYVNYSVGLLDAVNKLQIRYQLNKRLSVQTETGTATGGDILYTFER